jgi:hypothetical protein
MTNLSKPTRSVLKQTFNQPHKSRSATLPAKTERLKCRSFARWLVVEVFIAKKKK